MNCEWCLSMQSLRKISGKIRRSTIGRIFSSRILGKAIIVLIGYFALSWLISPDIMIELLNGLFIGTLATVAIVFRKVLLEAIEGKSDYGRVEQFALGLGFQWLALTMGRINSIWLRSSTPEGIIDRISYHTTGLMIATAIVAGVMQITAPGWESGYLHGRDRRTLLVSSAVGLAIAFALFLLQRFKIIGQFDEYLLRWLG